MALAKIAEKLMPLALKEEGEALTTQALTAEQTQFLVLPEGRVAYDVRGEGPLVICAPGMGDLRSVYRFMAPPVAHAGYRVALMDLRGHGDSDGTFT